MSIIGYLFIIIIIYAILQHYYIKLTTTPEERARRNQGIKDEIIKQEREREEHRILNQKKEEKSQGFLTDRSLNGYSQYLSHENKKKYVNSMEWSLIRDKIIQRDKQCVTCMSVDNLNVHHIHYLRLKRENLFDLVILCQSCHEKLHLNKGYSRQGMYLPEGYNVSCLPSHKELLSSYQYMNKVVPYREASFGSPHKHYLDKEYEEEEEEILILDDDRTMDGSIVIGSSTYINVNYIDVIEELDLSSDEDLMDGYKFRDIHRLGNLKSLTINNQSLEEIPHNIFKLNNLEVLNLSNNKIVNIPENIKQFTKLKILNLSNNMISSIPDHIKSISRLQYLNLQNNKIIDIQCGIGNLTALTYLNISNNENTLSSVPQIIYGLPNLDEFSINSIKNAMLDKNNESKEY